MNAINRLTPCTHCHVIRLVVGGLIIGLDVVAHVVAAPKYLACVDGWDNGAILNASQHVRLLFKAV